MKTLQDLKQELSRIDGKGYKAYKDIQGAYEADGFDLFIDHVQGDPFAGPSRVRVRVRHDLPEWTYRNKSRVIALRDFINRRFFESIGKHSSGNRGSGKSGALSIDRPGQEVLEKTSIVLDDGDLEARFTVGLPAFGRKIAGKQARAIFAEELPAIVEDALFYEALDPEALEAHVLTREDADALRRALKDQDLIGFVAEDSILPRASGVDPRPLKGAVPFRSPGSLQYTFELPNRTISGMGVPQGVTLIVGGGYHGKSTLLQALETGVYDHISGDGREFVVTDPDAVKVQAEDGRSIEKVDISPFINDLPHGKDTKRFTSENASGSTSQAANTMEALEVDASALLIDEDTSATNFMIRDDRMQQLVPKDREPITPYIDKARQLFEDKGVSTLLVIGGSGAYFDIADTVICMVEYEPYDKTEEAREIARQHQDERKKEGGADFGSITPRTPKGNSLDPMKGKKMKVRSRGVDQIQFGTTDIDLSGVEQLVHPGQVRAIADAMVFSKKKMEGRTLKEVVDLVMEEIDEKSLDVVGPFKSGDYAAFRKIELAATINRLRTLEV